MKANTGAPLGNGASPLPEIPLLASVLLALACAILPFLPTLANGFVWDDHLVIEANPALRQPFDSFNQLLALGPARTPFYRPVSVLWWSLLRIDFGLGPTGFHAANLLLHAAATTLLLLIARRLLPPLPALIGAVLFAVHPVHVEPVAFATPGATELLPAVFFLGGLWLLLPPRDDHEERRLPGPRRLWGAAALYLMALFSKETAIVFPLLAAVALFHPRLPPRRRWREALLASTPFAVATLVYGLLRVRAMLHLDALPPVPVAPGSAWFLPTWLLTALKLLFFPYRLSPFHELSPASVLEVQLLFALLALAVYATVRLGRARGWDLPVLLGLVLLLTPLVPALPLLPRPGALLAERFLYLPSAGFCILLGCAVVPASRRLHGHARFAAAAAVALLFVVLGSWSFVRSRDWRDNLTLFSRALDREPDNPRLLINRAQLYLKAIQPERAEPLIFKALSLNAPHEETQTLLAQCYQMQGRLDAAEEVYRRLLATKIPAGAAGYAWFGLGSLRMQQGFPDRGEKEFFEAVKVSPSIVEAYVNLADIAHGRGDVPAAIRVLEQGAASNPASADLLAILGTIRLEQGEREQARRDLKRALELNPAHALARDSLTRLEAGK